MSFLKTIWGLLFRLFPCPTEVGLRRVGSPGPGSPVLVTCNFDLTVKRLIRALRGMNVWLLVAQSKGVNVWCAAGGGEFNTHSVVSALKTSELQGKVNQRTLILPPLAAPGVRADDVEKQTGWQVTWGPVRAKDIPRYLAEGCRRDEGMKRVTYAWKERLDTALGSLFPFYLLGAVGFALFGRHLLIQYLVAGAVTFLLFMLACPWLPGRRGPAKALSLDVLMGAVLAVTEIVIFPGGSPLRAYLIISMMMVLVYGGDLGGVSPTMEADLEPILARLGIKGIGNIALAGTVSYDLVNGYRELVYKQEVCIGCRMCVEVCPQGVWHLDDRGQVIFTRKERCTACRACLVQCRSSAIEAPFIIGPAVGGSGRESTKVTHG
jgi:ferredoxin